MRCEFAFADVDECIVTPEVCGTGGTCVNTVGSYVCTCTSGYIWSSDDGTCVSKLHVSSNAMCTHTSTCMTQCTHQWLQYCYNTHTLQHAGLNAHTNGCSIATTCRTQCTHQWLQYCYNTHFNLHDSMHTPMVAVLLQHTLQHAGLNAHTNGCSIATTYTVQHAGLNAHTNGCITHTSICMTQCTHQWL